MISIGEWLNGECGELQVNDFRLKLRRWHCFASALVILALIVW